MDYINLGKAGVKVSRICLGTAFRANLFKPDFDEAACERVIEHAIAQGINFIDTANFYSYGRSESIVGKVLRGKRDDIILATKVRSPVKDQPGPNDTGLSRFHILREVERSLKRLQTDHIDLYLAHHFDDSTPIDETLRAMDDLVRSGKVRYIGCCNFTAWHLCEALWRSEVLNLNGFACVQNQYSLLNRHEVEPDLAEVCRKYGMGMMTYSPLAIGLLSGQFRHGETPPAGTPWAKNPTHYARHMTAQAQTIVDAARDIGAAHHKTPGQVAVAWLLDHPEVTSIITGPDTIEQLDDVLGALDCKLSRDERTHLDEVSQFQVLPRIS